jgi:enterochelin esterase-like enzyme
MRYGPDTDRLAVWTFVEAGEEIPCGDPSVTDAERAAAGRQTLAERFQDLLEPNRRRAAEQYATGGLPDGQDVARVWCPRDPAVLSARLGSEPLTAWAEGDVLHVLWQGHAEEVHLVAGVQPRLWPVDGAGGLWEVSLRIRRLSEAIITIAALPSPADGTRGAWAPDTLVWRGPQAPADLPSADPLHGTLEERTLQSAALRAPRGVTVYRPPGAEGTLPGCVLSDGASVTGFAKVLEPAMLAGTVPPVVLVGVHNAVDRARPWPDRRAQEYLPGHNRRRFDAHLGFVAGEVIPWAASRYGVAEGPWATAGFSNGGAWAIAAAKRRPDLFTAVAALSVGVVPRQLTCQARTTRVRHYLAAGTLEPGFRRATRQWAERLQRAGLPCHYEEWVGGHDQCWWHQQLPSALAWCSPRHELAPSALAWPVIESARAPELSGQVIPEWGRS